jgi:hypothetical protein
MGWNWKVELGGISPVGYEYYLAHDVQRKQLNATKGWALPAGEELWYDRSAGCGAGGHEISRRLPSRRGKLLRQDDRRVISGRVRSDDWIRAQNKNSCD